LIRDLNFWSRHFFKFVPAAIKMLLTSKGV
jgi:hypothetical protein